MNHGNDMEIKRNISWLLRNRHSSGGCALVSTYASILVVKPYRFQKSLLHLPEQMNV